MTTLHLSRDARVDTIMKAAAEVILEDGIEGTTITAIATRSGVSRQWLYQFFPDVESIFVALFEETRREYFVSALVAAPRTESFLDYVKEETADFLNMPPAAAMVTMYALNGGPRNPKGPGMLRTLIYGAFEETWVEPLKAAGFSSEEVLASVVTVTNAALGLTIAISDGLTTMEIARNRLDSLVESLIGDAATPLDALLGFNE